MSDHNRKKRKKLPMAAWRLERRQRNPAMDELPQWKVIFHYPIPDGLTFDNVAEAIHTIAHFPKGEVCRIIEEYWSCDSFLILITHYERAELLEEQFTRAKLKVTIEPVSV